jgi:hypothetical protein
MLFHCRVSVEENCGVHTSLCDGNMLVDSVDSQRSNPFSFEGKNSFCAIFVKNLEVLSTLVAYHIIVDVVQILA